MVEEQFARKREPRDQYFYLPVTEKCTDTNSMYNIYIEIETGYFKK